METFVNDKVSKIIFIKNVFKSDCTNMDDLMEKKIMQTTDETIKMTNVNTYEKLPLTFTSIKTWIQSTNILCWNCDRVFSGVPVFIPKTIEPHNDKLIMSVYGCFCSFNCQIAYINLYCKSIHDRINKESMCKMLFKEFYGFEPKEIIPSPSKYCMIQYGGDMTSRQYHLQIRKLQKKSGITFNVKNLSKNDSLLLFSDDDINYMGDLF